MKPRTQKSKEACNTESHMQTKTPTGGPDHVDSVTKGQWCLRYALAASRNCLQGGGQLRSVLANGRLLGISKSARSREKNEGIQ